MRRNLLFITAFLLSTSTSQAFWGISSSSFRTEGATTEAQKEAIPRVPDYAEDSQWYASDRGAAADIFYVISTETGDYTTAEGDICHFADTYDDDRRTPMKSEMEGVDELIAGQLNFYSPYYRQTALQTFTSDSLIRARMPLATDDVRRAFAYYLEHKNPDRPFILAGFSQGAYIAMDMVREMKESIRNRMVAVYFIGIPVTQQFLDTCPDVAPAQGATDTGVFISYNSVRDASCSLYDRTDVAINPVNWRTDSQPATLITEPSPLVPIEQQQKDHLTVRLDQTSHLLFVDGYTATDYVLPLIGKAGNYHSREIWLYREQLRENMQQRVEAWFQHHEK